jgi:hypothetical protein
VEYFFASVLGHIRNLGLYFLKAKAEIGVSVAQENYRDHISCKLCIFTNRDSAVGIATNYGQDDRGVAFRVPVGSRIFSSPCLADRLLGLFTQPPIRLIPGDLSPELKRPGVKLTTHLQLVPRSRKYGPIHPLLHTPSWRSASLVTHRATLLFYLYLYGYRSGMGAPYLWVARVPSHLSQALTIHRQTKIL